MGALTKWWQLIVLILGGSMSAWAAKLTAALTPYAPLSWVMVGLVSASILAVIILLIGKAMEMFAKFSFIRKIEASTLSVNVLDTLFERKQIKLFDLRNPYNPVHKGRTFIDCELIGPGVIYFDEHCSLSGVELWGCDCVAVKIGAPVKNVLVLSDATLRGGKIYGATILFPQDSVPNLSKMMPGLTWIT